MLIVDLVLAICMVDDAQKCREEHLYFESHGSLRQCMFQAIPYIAQWSGQHPQWKVKDFHCEWADGLEQKT